MNKKKALEQLMKFIEEYEDDFIFHDIFLEELIRMVTSELAGNEKPFFKQLVKQFKFINSQRKNVHMANGNELLKEFPNGDWYSIHVETKTVNGRLIIRFLDNLQPVFLVCFNEKSGKRISEYEQYKDIVVKRFEEVKEELSNE